MSEDGRQRALSDGNSIPTVGLGVWQVQEGRDCEQAVLWALEAGYRHIDTAQAYGNEASVGRALRDSGVPREDVFITTKFYPARTDPAAEAEKSLERLGIDQIDLYIIHWPQKGATWAWPGMEAARDRGHARSIGVSNFSVAELEQVIGVANTPPVVNQVQFSPFEYRRELLEACTSHGVAVEAYSPLGTGRHLDDPRSPRWPSAWAGPRRRSSSAGAFSATRSCCPSPPTRSASMPTSRSSTSRSPTRTWRCLTAWTRATAPTRRASASGGDAGQPLRMTRRMTARRAR